MEVSRRFWAKIKKTEGCWLWQGATNKKTGQAQFNYEGKNTQAYRVAWILTNGVIPDGFYVCHHCDNPACVRPDHLFLGTALDNSQDRDNKGRGIQPTGENNGMSKLKAEDVKEIKDLLKQPFYGLSKQICEKYGIHRHTLDAIKEGKTWREV